MLGLGDIALLQHLVEDDLLTQLVLLQGVVGDIGVIAGGVVGDADEAGALGQRQLRHRLAEIGEGGGAHTVAALAQVDVVEVHLQDLFLAVVALELQGAEDLQDLPLHRHVVVLGHVLDELLGDGGAAVGVLHPQEHVEEGAARPPPVHALVLPEALVLDGHQGVDQVLRDLLIVHLYTVLLPVEGPQLPGLAGGGGGVVDGGGQVHGVGAGVHVVLRNDDGLDIGGGKTGQDGTRGASDEDEGADDLQNAQDHPAGAALSPGAPGRFPALVGGASCLCQNEIPPFPARRPHGPMLVSRPFARRRTAAPGQGNTDIL